MGLSGPAVLFLGVIGLIWVGLYLVGLGRRWGVLVPFGLMLLASSTAAALDYYGNTVTTMWTGFQSRRAMIFLAGGVAAAAVVVMQFGRLAGSRLAVSSLVLFFIGVYAALLRFYHGGPADGAQSFVFAVMTLLPMVFAAPLVGSAGADFVAVLRSVAVVNAVWGAMVAMQFLVDSTALTMGNQYRFVGLTGNPQHAGVLLAFWSAIVLWLLLNDRGKVLRVIYGGLLGANLIMLAWTGSRTGMGMGVIGFAAIMYTRMGRAVLFMPVVAVIAYFGFKAVLAVTGLEVGVDRLATLEDTRTGAWLTLYQTGAESPLFGVGMDEAERSENSWLYAFATYGIGMFALVMVLTLVAMIEFLRGVKLRSWLPLEDRRLLDLCLGIIAMYFAGAVLEGYIISRVHPSLCIYIIAAGVAAMLCRQASLARLAAQSHDGSWDEDYAEGGAEGEDGGWAPWPEASS
jgi:hypothetical protein